MRRAVLPALSVLLLLTAGCTIRAEGSATEPAIAVDPPDGGGAGPMPAPGEPIPVEGDGGIGGPAGSLDVAPPFGVSSEVASAVVEPASSCWTPEGGGPGVCADGFPVPQDHVISVDSQLVVTYPAGDMTFEVGPAFDGDPSAPGTGVVPPDTSLPFEMEHAGIWLVSTADLEPGEYALWLNWNGAQGSSSAVMTIRVT